MTGFGAAYALVSLTCTIAPFLAIVVASFRAGSAWTGAALFVADALGMGPVVGVAAVAVALARSSLGQPAAAGRAVCAAGGGLLDGPRRRVRGLLRQVELRVLAGSATDDPVVGTASRLQAILAAAVAALGSVWLLVILAGLVALPYWYGATRNGLAGCPALEKRLQAEPRPGTVTA